jgi:Xaa-Pro aminopeptidase
MRHSFSLETTQVEENILKLSNYLRENGIEAAYISSFDIFMNEYVPMQECHRYYLTGFSGSVAEVLLLASGKCLLFVDGRYHEQADIEVKANGVEVVKCPYGKSLFEALQESIVSEKIKSLWINGDRSSLGSFECFKSLVSTVICESDSNFMEVVETTEFHKETTLSLIDNVVSSKEKAKRFLKEGEAYWVSALDSISWITNLRGYGLPFQSSFMARCLVKSSEIQLSIPEHYNKENISSEFLKISNTNLKSFSSNLNLSGITKLYYDPALINVSDYLSLKTELGKGALEERAGGITKLHAIKTEDEMKLIDSAFASGDKAIYNTICWARDSFESGVEFSEVDVFHKTTEFYEAEGSKEQSFGTISGLGANSSIIHYSSPSDEVKAEDGMILLLDSGGFFEGGFATDTTRTIFLGKGEPTDKQKLVYTLVLKGMLQAQNAVFPKGTWGSHIDALARTPILRGGFNFAHGTGHGVGINVHEGGLRFSPTSSIPLELGNVGSIEPGIYLPGFGGVRLENIVTVVEHPEFKDMLMFRPLVFIGFDHSLIDFSLLEEVEKSWLSEYEVECERRGTLYSK